MDKQVQNRYVSALVRACSSLVGDGIGAPGLAAAFVNDDGLGKTILCAHAVFAPEELEEAETALEHRSAVAEGSLDGLPQSQTVMSERDGARTGDPFSRCAAVADEVGETKVEYEEDEIAGLVKIPDDVHGSFVENLEAPENFGRSPKNDGDDEVEKVAEHALRKGGKEQTLEFLHACGFMRAKGAAAGAGLFLDGGGHRRVIEGSTEAGPDPQLDWHIQSIYD